jgi:hypothetical protein
MDQNKSGSKEPDWTKNIKSSTVCNFFYYFFLVYVVLGIIALIGLVVDLFTLKMSRGLLISSVFTKALVLALSGTMALFHYLVCARALDV